MEAAGIMEVYGLACAFAAADAGCKAGNVRLEDFDRNRPGSLDGVTVPLLITIKFRGAVADVEAAISAAETAANAHSGFLQSHIIAAPTQGADKFLKNSGFDKN